MTRVEVNAGGRHIILDQDGRDAELLAKHAIELWRDTAEPTQRPAGFAIGHPKPPAAER